jgi:hypothetical protein
MTRSSKASLASNSIQEANNLVLGNNNARSLFLDMTDKERLDGLISQADLVVRSAALNLEI